MLADDILRRNLEQLRAIAARLSRTDWQMPGIKKSITETEQYLAEFVDPPVAPAVPVEFDYDLYTDAIAKLRDKVKDLKIKYCRPSEARLGVDGFWHEGFWRDGAWHDAENYGPVTTDDTNGWYR